MSDEGQALENPEVGQEQSPQFDPTKVAALVERLDQLEATNKRLLEESKVNKQKAKDYRSQIEAREEDDLRESKNFEELLAVKENRNKELESRLQDLELKTKTKSLQIEVSRHATNAHDMNDVFNNLPKDKIAYNESTGAFEGVDEAVRMIKESKPWLFKSESIPSMASSKPEAKQEKSFEDKVAENPDAALRELLKKQLG